MSDPTFDQFITPNHEQEEAKFFSFVNEQISKMQKYSNIDIDNLSFDQLNRQLGMYNQIYLALLSLKAFASTELKKVQMEYDLWYASFFTSVRNKLSREVETKAKWPSLKEIDFLVSSENKEEYTKRNYELMLTESRCSFIDSMIKAWEVHSHNLNTLSKNIQTETSLAFKNN